MEFKFKNEQTDYEKLLDKVTIAMETGNTGRAREIIAEHADTFPAEIREIQSAVIREYGVRL